MLLNLVVEDRNENSTLYFLSFFLASRNERENRLLLS